MLIIIINSLFLHVLSATANGQLQNQHEYEEQQQYDNKGQTKTQRRGIT
jgi:hypothetical protein